MTREEKIDVLERYCDHGGNICKKCELKKMYDKETYKFTNKYSCQFYAMDDDMLDKCYDWLKDVNPTAYENAQDSCCDKESNVDMVNHPAHYTQGGIECIDALKAATVSKTGIEAVCTANAIKYLWRYEEKNGIEDVKKARWYIDRLIRELEEKE